MSETERLNGRSPDLRADVLLYATAEGGRKGPILPGYGCPCIISKSGALRGWDARLLLGDGPMYPGDRRRLGFVFLSPEAIPLMLSAGSFFLWEGRFIGEATIFD